MSRRQWFNDWTKEDYEKVRHMMKRGKSDDFIAGYMGMDPPLVAAVRRRMVLDGEQLGGEFGRRRMTPYSKADEDDHITELTRRRKAYASQDAAFLQRLREVGHA
jgi:hypothetical protein